MTKLRVLLIAEAANPNQVSVPLEGWSLTRALSDICDVHLVTQVRNRSAIEATGWREGHEFTALDSEAVARPMNRVGKWFRGGRGKGWTTVMAMRLLPYLYFERLVWNRFRDDLRSGRFDLVHRLIPISPTIPSPISGKLRRLGVPFVIGPLNGGLPWPREFDTARRQEREWLSYIRGAHKFVPGFHATRRNASALIVGSRATLDQMPPRYHDKCHLIPENAVDPARFSLRRTRTARRPIRCVFLGRLVPYKGPDMLLDAATTLLRNGDITIQFIGDGPLRDPLQRTVDQRSLPGVEFLGRVEHHAVEQYLVQADLLTFPSIREFGGAVALEAMALGVPPLVVDYGGPGELVTDETGFKIPPADRETMVARLHDELKHLVDHPEQIDRRGAPARERVLSQFTWNAKARQVAQIYAAVMGSDSATDPFRSPPGGESSSGATTSNHEPAPPDPFTSNPGASTLPR